MRLKAAAGRCSRDIHPPCSATSLPERARAARCVGNGSTQNVEGVDDPSPSSAARIAASVSLTVMLHGQKHASHYRSAQISSARSRLHYDTGRTGAIIGRLVCWAPRALRDSLDWQRRRPSSAPTRGLAVMFNRHALANRKGQRSKPLARYQSTAPTQRGDLDARRG